MTNDELNAAFEQISAESRALLASTVDVKVTKRNPLHVEPLVRQRPQPKPTEAPRQPAPTAREIDQMRARDWTAWAEALVARKLGPLREAIGQAIGEERRKSNIELQKRDLRIDALTVIIGRLQRGEQSEIEPTTALTTDKGLGS